MIITCPSCATRYDVDDRRFSPDGRSVRCAECDESWFVPAPQPIEDLIPLKKHSRVYAEAEGRESPPEASPAREPRRDYRDDAEEDPVDEPLFEATPPRSEPSRSAASDREIDEDGRGRDPRVRAEAAPPPLERDKKGRFVKTKKQEAEDAARDAAAREDRRAPERAPSRSPDRPAREADERRFGRSRTAEDSDPRDARNEARYDARHDWRGADPRDARGEDTRSDRAELRAEKKRRGPAVVDADFEDIDTPRTEQYDDPFSKGFGRKVREERRRETALARLEDLEPVAERIFNEEFFTALRVQPKELERAIRKARRRAEAREKNRLTPLRAIGWSAWVGAIAACAFVAYSYRNNIVAMFPNAKGAYEAVGIEANPYGLKIEGVTHRVALSPEGPVIEILGRLKNDEAGDVTPPMLLAEALGPDGDVLSRWTFAARAERVRAGQYADFLTRAPAPEGVSEVVLSFAPAEGVKVSVGDLLKPQN